MGLFWNADYVFWGKKGPNKKGRLLGTLQNKIRNGVVVDFWKQIGIYALFLDYQLVYVGQTKGTNLGPRLREHMRDYISGRWNAFSWFGMHAVTKKNQLRKANKNKKLYLPLGTVLNTVEGICIEIAEPHLNLQSGRFNKDVEVYMQKKGAEVVDIPTRLENIEKSILDLTNKRRLRAGKTMRTP